MSSEPGVDVAEADRPDGRRQRWQEHNLARRQVIIDAAIAVLEGQAPGEEVQVQAVADEAGMSRTVIYRHFEDRADLDRAVQRTVCAQVGDLMLPALSTDGTPEEIIRRLVSGLVCWATEHPTLYWFAERDLAGWGPSPMNEAVGRVAAGIEGVMGLVLEASGVELDEVDQEGLDPWVFALIGAVFAAVRRWLERPERKPSVEGLVSMLTESLWLQIDGMAQTRGVHIPNLPVADLLQAISLTEDE